VVHVEVAEQHGVDGIRLDVALQRPERAIAEVEHDAPRTALVLGLDEVAGRR
jgi:hypothetical protein